MANAVILRYRDAPFESVKEALLEQLRETERIRKTTPFFIDDSDSSEVRRIKNLIHAEIEHFQLFCFGAFDEKHHNNITAEEAVGVTLESVQKFQNKPGNHVQICHMLAACDHLQSLFEQLKTANNRQVYNVFNHIGHKIVGQGDVSNVFINNSNMKNVGSDIHTYNTQTIMVCVVGLLFVVAVTVKPTLIETLFGRK